MLEIIGIACIGVLWINAEPTIRIREWFASRVIKKIMKSSPKDQFGLDDDTPIKLENS